MQVNFYNTGAPRSYSAPAPHAQVFKLTETQQGVFVHTESATNPKFFTVGLSLNQRRHISQAIKDAKLSFGQASQVSRQLNSIFNVPHWAALPPERFPELELKAQQFIAQAIERSKELNALAYKQLKKPHQKKAGENIARFLSDVYMIRRHLERQRDAIDQLLKRLDAPNEEEQMIKALEALGL